MPTEEHVALRDPGPGKQGATIERAKYDQVRAAILAVLGRCGSLTYTQLAEVVERELGDAFPELYRTSAQGRHYLTVATAALVPEERR